MSLSLYRKKILLCLMLAMFCVGVAPVAESAKSDHPVKRPQEIAKEVEVSPVTRKDGKELDGENLVLLKARVEALRERVENLSGQINTLTAFLGILVALGGVGSFYAWLKSERRAQESHNLAIRGETSTQSRADEVHKTFLEGSKNTLDLVNATLTLAKEASERAAKFIESKAKSTLEELDNNAKALIKNVPSHDYRALVAKTTERSKLRSLAKKIASFETNRFVLPTEIELTPACLFIRGMDFHLDQQFLDAIGSWQRVALTDKADETLKSLAWYWIGYENNNLGKFSDAIISFQRALEHAGGPQKYELQRIAIESQFFNNEAPGPLVKALDNLLRVIASEAGEEIEDKKRKIHTTLGNIHHYIGEQYRKKGESAGARDNYESAISHFRDAGEQEKWGVFGYAEALYRLNEKDKALMLFKDKVRPLAQDEYIRREEPRTKVLARTTELICCVRVPELQNEIPGVRSDVIDALGVVNEQLTVYSQVQRRNISKTDFIEDLRQITQES